MMGDPMARRLIHAGHNVTVWDRSPSHTEPFRPIATVAGSPADAVAGAEFVVTMLATPQALEGVLFGVDGVSSSFTGGQTWIDMSTAVSARAMHREQALAFIHYLLRPDASAVWTAKGLERFH